MSDTAEKVVAELRAKATRLEKTFKLAPPLTLVEADVMREAAALIESQRATIERVKRERDSCADKAVEQTLKLDAAQARVTALEAEKAGAIKLADGYGIVLTMIAAGCSNPQRFAKRMLAEYEAETKKLGITK